MRRKDTKTQDKFIEDALRVHGDKYNYSKTKYITARKKIIITCPIHGDFEQNPNKHLLGSGCNACGIERQRKKVMLTEKEFKDKIFQKYGNYYTFGKYTGHNQLIDISCPKHGDISKNAGYFLRGGCILCARESLYGLSKEAFIKMCKKDDAYLYIIAMKNSYEQFIKLGISKNGVRKRNPSNGKYKWYKFMELQNSPDKIWDLEDYLHKELNDFKYKPKIRFGGHTECFDFRAMMYIPDLLLNTPLLRLSTKQ